MAAKYDLEGNSGLSGTLGRPREHEGITMPNNMNQKNYQSLKEKNSLNLEKEMRKLLYQKSWMPCFGKSVYKQRKDASSTRIEVRQIKTEIKLST